MAKRTPSPVWVPVKAVKGRGVHRGETRVPMEVVVRGDYAFLQFTPLVLSEEEERDPQFSDGSWTETWRSTELPEAENTLF